MPDLPTSAIGLIGFIVSGAALLIWRLSKVNIETFMTYIEKKNNNLERTSENFAEAMEKVAQSHKEAIDAILKARP